MKFIKSPLRYPGGKSRAIKQIMPLIPLNITEYREPFIGGASVYFAIRSLFRKTIQYQINDLNYDLVCFWRAVQLDVFQLSLAVRKLSALYEYLKGDDYPQAEFDRAVRFFIMNRITFSGVMDAGGYSQQAFDNRFTPSSIERLEHLAHAFDNTQILHGDYEPLIQQPGEKVFIFLDPPYLSATKSRLYGVKGDLHVGFDHERFAENMRKCPHRWLITYDDSPEIRSLFDFADVVEWQLQYGMNNFKQDTAAIGNELFIKNY